MNKGQKNNNSGHRVKNDSNVSDDLLKNPEALARLQDDMDIRLKALKNYEQLPLIIKNRVRALKNLQLDVIKIEENFFRELSQLEARFYCQYQVVYDKRNEIVMGLREPTDLESSYPSDNEEIDELTDGVKNTVAVTSGDDKEEVTDAAIVEKGIPEFWLKVLQHSDIIRVNIQENDIKVLKYLSDVKCILKSGEENGFVLEFFFSPNEFFTDEKLTKEYFVHVSAPKTYPLTYEGPEIVRTKGCPIHWCPGKNVTVKLVKKVQKSKNRSEKRTVTKVVKNDSFFNFFDPPTESLNSEEEISSDVENILEADFEMGQYLRERLIPRAVLYYTGEGLDDEFDEMDEDDEDEDDSDEDSDEEHRRPRVGGRN